MRFRSDSQISSKLLNPDKRRFSYRQEIYKIDWFKSTPHYSKVDAMVLGEVLEIQSDKSNKIFKIRRLK